MPSADTDKQLTNYGTFECVVAVVVSSACSELETKKHLGVLAQRCCAADIAFFISLQLSNQNTYYLSCTHAAWHIKLQDFS